MPKKPKNRPRRRALSDVLLVAGAIAVAGIVVAGVWLAVNGDDTPSRRAALRQPTVVSDAQQVGVDVFDNDFEPRTLTVNKGATVTWTFTGDLPHNVTDDRGAFASETKTEGEYARTFEAAGVFYYYCTIHHGMQGTLTVRS